MANDHNRSIVENYIYHKLSKRGYVWGFNGVRDAAAAAVAANNNGDLGEHSPSLVRRCLGEAPGPDSDSRRLHGRLSRPDHSADIHRVLRDAGDELERLYQPDFAEMSQRLYLTGDAARTKFAEVAHELFRDGVNWGRIVAFLEFGGTVCVECASREELSAQVDGIADWMTEYLSGTLDSWIQDNGGWNAFVELYESQKESVFSCYWPSIKTVFGLAAIGAASITIGAYLAQK